MRVMLAIAGAILVAIGLYTQIATRTQAATVEVDVLDDVFDDATVTISAGDTVTWTWVGTNAHTVTSDTGAFDSGTMGNGGSFSFTFNTAGTYSYYCAFHGGPGGFGMAGSVVVQAAPTATNTTTTQATATRTREASSTPVTATSTPAASATPGAPVATVPVDPTAESAAPISAPAPQGGAGAGVGAPRTGDGAGATATRQYDLFGIAIGIAGVALIAGAAVLRRRKP